MKVKRYQAATSREALAKVKKELGGDAVILSNRSVAGGVEILALASNDVPAVTAAQPAPRAQKAVAQAPAIRKAEFPKVDAPKAVVPAKATGQEAVVPAQAGTQVQDSKLFDELRAMRGLVEQQLANLAWGDEARRHPVRSQVLRDLITAGFSAPLGRKVAAALPQDLGANEAAAWLKGILARNLRCATAEDNMVERGGTYALVGPTGVGKTTTVAKLAARCVVRFGAQKLALITTDVYRVGAQDQLRIYAKILGVPVHVVQDAAGLEQVLSSLTSKHLVLIDTVGMAQRDPRADEQAELLADPRVRRVLLLNAASQVETLEDVARAYARRGPLYAAILSKLDEARRPGAALDVIMRHRLALAFVTDGQRVPEDIRLPAAAELVAKALDGAADSPFALKDEELLLLRAA